MKSNIAWSVVLAVIGFLVLFAGIMTYEISLRNKSKVPVYSYILLIIGIIMLVIGFILITYFYDKNNNQ